MQYVPVGMSDADDPSDHTPSLELLGLLEDIYKHAMPICLTLSPPNQLGVAAFIVAAYAVGNDEPIADVIARMRSFADAVLLTVAAWERRDG